MSKRLAVAFGIGLAIAALGVGWVFYAQRGEHLQPKGRILKSRTLELEKTRSLLVLETRIVNDSDVAMTVRSLEIAVETSDGKVVDGVILSPKDLKGVFEFNPVLGEQYNPVLSLRDEIGPRSTADRTLSASFEIPLADLDRRKEIKVRVEDQTGPVAEFLGK